MGAGPRLSPLAACVALAACAAPAPRDPSPVVATTDRGLAARGTSSVVVRTRVAGPFGPADAAGIACTLQAPGFRAAFATPARVEVPNLGARQPAALLTCSRDGQSQSLTLPPVNLTRVAELGRAADNQSRQRDFLGLGMMTAAIVGGLRRDRATDIRGYADATLLFHE